MKHTFLNVAGAAVLIAGLALAQNAPAAIEVVAVARVASVRVRPGGIASLCAALPAALPPSSG